MSPRKLGVRRCEGCGSAGAPAEDTAKLPLFDDPRNKRRRTAEELAVRPEGQLESSVAADVVCPMKGQQSLVQTPVSWIHILHIAVAGLFAKLSLIHISEP